MDSTSEQPVGPKEADVFEPQDPDEQGNNGLLDNGRGEAMEVLPDGFDELPIELLSLTDR